MTLAHTLESSETGVHMSCQKCPWSPKRTKKAAYGVSCREHGIDWSVPTSAVSIQIAQDPAGTTPERTGRLCDVCNSRNPSDHSAQHGFALWKAAVSLAQSGQAARKYLKHHYWTNAVMHGVKDKSLEEARTCCKGILREQIELLSPCIIIVCGKVAAESLYDLKLISRYWDDFSRDFSQQVYSERTVLPSGKEVTIYCTYHSSATAVNTHIAKRYSKDIDELLSHRIKQLPDTIAASHFLRQYPKETAEGKGMRVLLLHWLEIGEGIRRAVAE